VIGGVKDGGFHLWTPRDDRFPRIIVSRLVVG
jgi:hypothetical protein